MGAPVLGFPRATKQRPVHNGYARRVRVSKPKGFGSVSKSFGKPGKLGRGRG